MPSQDHLKAIGKALVARRASLDPARHRNRTGWMATVTAKTALSKRVIIDIETGARDNYSVDTLTTLEDLYRLQSGTLALALDGGPLVSDTGARLHPTPDDGSEDRYRTEDRTHRLTGRVWQIVRDLEADTEGIPDEVAEEMLQRAMDNAEAQARIMLDAERNRWERQRHTFEHEAEDQT